ncbi:MAG: hypothetical protein LBP86_03910, partial [Azoarcus sp.]|nr:hypothetical protein [Azoarcus sp.]
TASIIFYSASSADLEYTYNGKSSALLLSRYTFSVPSLAGKWRFAALVTDDDTGEDASHSGSAVFSDAGASGNTRTYSIAGDLAAHPALDFRSFNLRSDGSLLVGSGCETGDVQKRCTVSKARLIGDTLLLEGTVETGPDTSRYNPFRLMAVRATD